MYKHSLFERLYAFILRHTNQQKYNLYIKELIDKYLRKFGPEIMGHFQDLYQNKGIDYWLTWGSILGYYREHHFIKGDNDVDVGMFKKDITLDLVDELIRRGFEYQRAIIDCEYKGIHITFNYKTVKVDLYSYEINADGTNYTGFAPMPINGDWKLSIAQNKYAMRWVTFPFKDSMTIDFVGTKTRVPVNTEEQLKILYGENFMTPIPGFKNTKNNNIIIEYSDTKYAYGCSYNELRKLMESHKL